MGFGIPLDIINDRFVGSLYMVPPTEDGKPRFVIPLGLNTVESLVLHKSLEQASDEIPDGLAADVFRSIIVTVHPLYAGDTCFQSTGEIIDSVIMHHPYEDFQKKRNRIALEITDPKQRTFLRTCYPDIFRVEWMEPNHDRDTIIDIEDLMRFRAVGIAGVTNDSK